jgi:hypothetical protein
LLPPTAGGRAVTQIRFWLAETNIWREIAGQSRVVSHMEARCGACGRPGVYFAKPTISTDLACWRSECEVCRQRNARGLALMLID